MAGGRGSRLKKGEKPMVTIFGRRLIEYVALALEESSAERITHCHNRECAPHPGLGSGLESICAGHPRDGLLSRI